MTAIITRGGMCTATLELTKALRQVALLTRSKSFIKTRGRVQTMPLATEAMATTAMKLSC